VCAEYAGRKCTESTEGRVLEQRASFKRLFTLAVVRVK
jgi:hypothetical protein